MLLTSEAILTVIHVEDDHGGGVAAFSRRATVPSYSATEGFGPTLLANEPAFNCIGTGLFATQISSKKSATRRLTGRWGWRDARR